jgi:hypothetical protein
MRKVYQMLTVFALLFNFLYDSHNYVLYTEELCMENYGLIEPEQGEVNPLRYHLTLGKRGLELHFTELGASELVKILQERASKKVLPKNFILPHHKEWGIKGVFVTKRQSLRPIQKDEFIVVEIPSNDKSKLRAIAETLANIFYFEPYLTAENVKKKDVYTGPVQLFSVSTMFSADEEWQTAALSFSVSPHAATFLAKQPPGTQVPDAVKEMKKQWLAITGTKRKDFEDAELFFSAHLKEHGMFRLSTVGNCACLGKRSEELKKNQGFHIASHNVDFSHQQINLLVGLACVWDWVRESLSKETA